MLEEQVDNQTNGQSMNLPRKVFFLHIPKAAGTSVTEIFTRGFGSSEIYRIKEDSYSQEKVHHAIARYRFVSGHVPYFLIEEHLEKLSCFTFLRNPIARVISLYRFWRRQDEALVRGTDAEIKIIHAKRATFPEFMASSHPLVRAEVSNGMCKMLLSKPSHTYGNLAEEELFAMAKANLSRIQYGIAEDVARSLELLQPNVNIPLNEGVSLNMAPRNEFKTFAGDDIEKVAAANLADTLLYKYAIAEFRKRSEDRAIANSLALGRALTPLHQIEGDLFSWTPDNPLCGSNWHEREMTVGGATYRFTSGEAPTTIYFDNPFNGEAVNIHLRVLFFAKDEFCDPIESLRLEINNVSTAFETVPLPAGGALIRATLPAVSNTLDYLKVSIGSSYGYIPKWAAANSPDDRSLFAAVSGIEVQISPHA